MKQNILALKGKWVPFLELQGAEKVLSFTSLD
jgi:hypothetical protein